jgi:hypothetical protein
MPRVQITIPWMTNAVLEVDGKIRRFRYYIDPVILHQMARKAARNRSGKSMAGAFMIEAVKEEDNG